MCDLSPLLIGRQMQKRSFGFGRIALATAIGSSAALIDMCWRFTTRGCLPDFLFLYCFFIVYWKTSFALPVVSQFLHYDDEVELAKMSASQPPPGWRPYWKAAEQFTAGTAWVYYQLTQPQRGLLENDDQITFLVRCGDPENDQDPKSCYVILNIVSREPIKIVLPITLEGIYEALPYWHTDERDNHFKMEKVEKVPRDQLPEEWRDFSDSEEFSDDAETAGDREKVEQYRKTNKINPIAVMQKNLRSAINSRSLTEETHFSSHHT